MEPPSPVISLVMPCDNLLKERLSISKDSSDCPSISMNPGLTTSPDASMTRLALAPSSVPMAAMRSPRIAISPAYHGFPVPSRMWPWRISTSYGASGMLCCLQATMDGARATHKQRLNPRVLLFGFMSTSLSRSPPDRPPSSGASFLLHPGLRFRKKALPISRGPFSPVPHWRSPAHPCADRGYLQGQLGRCRPEA